MIQRILFCIFTTIVFVSSQDGSSMHSMPVIVTLSSGIVAPSSLQSSSAKHSNSIIASSSEHVDPTSIQSDATAHKSTSSAVSSANTEHVDPTSIQSDATAHKSTSSAVSSANPAVLSTISSVMPSSPVGPVSKTTAKTPLLSSTIVSLTSSAAPLVSSTAPMRSSSVIITGVPDVTASPTAVPWPETIVINNTAGTYCLMALLKAKFKISYKRKNKNGTFTASVPLNGENPTLKGHCDKEIANFSLTWNERGKTSNVHTFSMQFENNITTNKTFWEVQKLSAAFDTNDSAFTDAKNKSIMATSNPGSSFGKFTDDEAYLCNSELDFTMGTVKIIFEKIILQPFSNKTELAKNGKHCSADDDDDDDDNNTVPIAVGAALGGLVLIVLVAYIIGRRRSNRGYEQV